LGHPVIGEEDIKDTVKVMAMAATFIMTWVGPRGMIWIRIDL
jgi:hypothetical protein